MNIKNHYTSRWVKVWIGQRLQYSSNRIRFSSAGRSNYCAVSGHELRNIHKRRNRLRTCEMTNFDKIGKISRPVDGPEISIYNNMHPIIYCRMLRDATSKTTASPPFPHKLDSE